MTPAEMRRRAAAGRVGRLATVGPGGRPHLVPVCFALVGATAYSAVDAKPKRSTRLQRLANIRAHPAACLLVDAYAEDWATLWWVRLDGDARVHDEGPEHAGALAALVAKYPQYAVSPPTGPVVALAVHRWTGWAADGS